MIIINQKIINNLMNLKFNFINNRNKFKFDNFVDTHEYKYSYLFSFRINHLVANITNESSEKN